MKKNLLQLLSALFAIGMIISCSSDAENDTTVNEGLSASTVSTARGSVWDGVIGEDWGNGRYVVTANEELILTDLQEIIEKEGHTAVLRNLEIVQKVATNDSGDRGFMLIGSDNQGTSIGVWMELQNNNFTLVRQPGLSTSTTCTGCATGCNLQYLTIDGKKVAYCNENGCIYDCEKSESDAL